MRLRYEEVRELRRGAENNLRRCAHVTFEFVWVRGQFWSPITDRHSGICTSMYRHSQSLRTYVWFWNTYNCLINHHLWAFLRKVWAQFHPQKTPMSLSKLFPAVVSKMPSPGMRSVAVCGIGSIRVEQIFLRDRWRQESPRVDSTTGWSLDITTPLYMKYPGGVG